MKRIHVMAAVIERGDHILIARRPDHVHQGGKWEFTGFAGFSRIDGDTAAVRRLQRSSAHNFQRPDQDHVLLNPTSGSGPVVAH